MVASSVTLLLTLGATPRVLVDFPDERDWLPLAASALVMLFLSAEFWTYLRGDRAQLNDALGDVTLLRGMKRQATELLEELDGEPGVERAQYLVRVVKIPEQPEMRLGFDFDAPLWYGAFALGMAQPALLDTPLAGPLAMIGALLCVVVWATSRAGRSAGP